MSDNHRRTHAEEKDEEEKEEEEGTEKEAKEEEDEDEGLLDVSGSEEGEAGMW